MKSAFRSLVAQLTALAFLFLGLFQPVQASMIGTDALLQAGAADSARATVQLALEAKEVRAQLSAWGVAPETVEARLAHLSDTELQQLAAHIEEAPAGGLAAALGILFVVLLVLELVGVINIFNAI